MAFPTSDVCFYCYTGNTFDIYDEEGDCVSKYFMDFTRSEDIYEDGLIHFMDDFKRGIIPSLISKNDANWLKKKKLVILANCLPRFSCLPLANWSFYNTTWRMINFKRHNCLCVPYDTTCAVTHLTLTIVGKEFVFGDENAVINFLLEP